MEVQVGTVIHNTSISKNGTFGVSFGQVKPDGKAAVETVRYVSPYGNKDGAWISIPLPGTVVLCAKVTPTDKDNTIFKGYYYLGSVMGTIPGLDSRVPVPGTNVSASSGPVPKNKTGVHGPPIPPGEVPQVMYAGGNRPAGVGAGHWPQRFQEMYEGKGVTPEQVGFTSTYGDDVLISNRSRSNSAQGPFQDHRVQIESGSGQAVKCVDSPIVKGIVMTTTHKGKDYFIFSSGNAKSSPFAEGEWHMRTHGPVNMYTTANNMHFYVKDGRNLQIENLAPGGQGYDLDGVKQAAVVSNTEDATTTRVGKEFYGNETHGCVEIRSKHNNVTIEALEKDSVIRIVAPGEDSKVIVHTAGTVDIVADKKITLESGTEIELNAPKIDINGGNRVFVDAPKIHLNNGSEA